MPFYAVARGRREGVYTTWAECQLQVKKFSGAVYKKCPSLSEATDFLIAQQANVLRTNLAAEECAASSIKQEEPYYLPLSAGYVDTKENIKQEPPNGSLWMEDGGGDEELLSALGALQEYPDNKPTPPKIAKKAVKKIKTENSRSSQSLKLGSYVFSVDDDGYIDVYIGGHTENVGSWNCMAGYGIYFGQGHPLNVAEAASGRMTRNVGDIEAAIEAIEIAQRVFIPKLCLHTSSQFLLNAVGFWMNNWKRNGWRNKDGKVVQNRKQFEKLYALLNEGSIDIKWTDARKEPGANKCMRGVKLLAKIGKEEYLDKHPSKDDSFSMDAFDYYDYY